MECKVIDLILSQLLLKEVGEKEELGSVFHTVCHGVREVNNPLEST